MHITVGTVQPVESGSGTAGFYAFPLYDEQGQLALVATYPDEETAAFARRQMMAIMARAVTIQGYSA